MNRYYFAEGSTEDHILAIKAEVVYSKDRAPRGYYLHVSPVERRRSIIPATATQPQQVFWSEICTSYRPSNTILLQSVARKSPKSEREAEKIGEKIHFELVEKIAHQIGWILMENGVNSKSSFSEEVK